MSQGFSTLYDLKMLNPYLLVKGTVVDEDLDPIVFDLPATPEAGE